MKRSKSTIKRALNLAAFYIGELPVGYDGYWLDAWGDEGVELDLPVDNEVDFWLIAGVLAMSPDSILPEMRKRLGPLTISLYFMPKEASCERDKAL